MSCENDPNHDQANYCTRCSTCHDCLAEALYADCKTIKLLQAENAKLKEELEAVNDLQGWVSVDTDPYCDFEHTEWNEDGELCLFDGMVSNTFLISDGTYIGQGHYQDDGVWRVYQGEHDFMNIDPDNITHYKKPLPPSEGEK